MFLGSSFLFLKKHLLGRGPSSAGSGVFGAAAIAVEQEAGIRAPPNASASSSACRPGLCGRQEDSCWMRQTIPSPVTHFVFYGDQRVRGRASGLANTGLLPSSLHLLRTNAAAARTARRPAGDHDMAIAAQWQRACVQAAGRPPAARPAAHRAAVAFRTSSQSVFKRQRLSQQNKVRMQRARAQLPFQAVSSNHPGL